MAIDKWDRRFMRMAQQTANWSKDPRAQIGCYIVDSDRNQLSGGFNGFPRGVADLPERLHEKAVKLQLVVHAEANAVAGAARKGTSLLGGIAYVTRQPCSQCTALLIQAGIRRLVYKVEELNDMWSQNFEFSKVMLTEAGVVVDEMVEELNAQD